MVILYVESWGVSMGHGFYEVLSSFASLLSYYLALSLSLLIFLLVCTVC